MAFVQDVEEMIQHVNETIDNMPHGLWAIFLVKMLHPFMLKLVKADSKKILPLKWMTALPTYRPPASMRQNYYDLCAVLLSDKNTHGTRCRELIGNMQKPAYDLIYGLFRRDHDKREFRDVFMLLSSQLQMINGQYTTYFFIKNHLRDFDFSEFLVSYVIQCGSVEFVLQAIRVYAAQVQPTHHVASENNTDKSNLIYTPRMQSLNALIAGLENHVYLQQERRTAVAMALHSRLGAAAMLGTIGNDILSTLAPVDTPKLVFWHELLLEFVGLKIE